MVQLMSFRLLFFAFCFSCVVDVSVFAQKKIFTEADSLRFFTEERVCLLMGNAKARLDYNEKRYIFQANEIKLRYNKDKTLAEIHAKTKVTFCCEGIIITANGCVFDGQTVVFLGNIRIQDKSIGILTADRASFDIKTKVIDVSSKSRVFLVIKDEKILGNKLLS
jgi:lipopolysaccharide export system protein LptA